MTFYFFLEKAQGKDERKRNQHCILKISFFGVVFTSLCRFIWSLFLDPVELIKISDKEPKQIPEESEKEYKFLTIVVMMYLLPLVTISVIGFMLHRIN